MSAVIPIPVSYTHLDVYKRQLMYKGAICDARFSKCCGGAFEEFQNCWENVKHPYLCLLYTSISGVTFVSVPGMVQASSFSYLQMVLGFIVGQFIIAFVLVPLFYRMNLVSIYEYLENRFGASSYKTGAWFFFISKMLGAAVRLFLVCLRCV